MSTTQTSIQQDFDRFGRSKTVAKAVKALIRAGHPEHQAQLIVHQIYWAILKQAIHRHGGSVIEEIWLFDAGGNLIERCQTHGTPIDSYVAERIDLKGGQWSELLHQAPEHRLFLHVHSEAGLPKGPIGPLIRFTETPNKKGRSRAQELILQHFRKPNLSAQSDAQPAYFVCSSKQPMPQSQKERNYTQIATLVNAAGTSILLGSTLFEIHQYSSIFLWLISLPVVLALIAVLAPYWLPRPSVDGRWRCYGKKIGVMEDGLGAYPEMITKSTLSAISIMLALALAIGYHLTRFESELVGVLQWLCVIPLTWATKKWLPLPK